MDQLFMMAKQVVWLDHHKTAFEMWCGGVPEIGIFQEKFRQSNVLGKDALWLPAHHIILNNNKSGALLAWEYFHPGTDAPMLFKHIDDYDRWQFKIDGTKEFNKALWSYAPWSFAQWHNTYDLTDDACTTDMYLEGQAILRAHDQNVQSMVKGSARACKMLHTKEQDASWYATHEHWEAEFDVNAVGLAANCPPHLTSDVGHALATQSGAFGLCWALSKEGMVAKCSLRSNGDYDVSEIAKVFGGGGHKNAAGFEVPITTLLGWLK
jgi:hypothetical protein